MKQEGKGPLGVGHFGQVWLVKYDPEGQNNKEQILIH